MSIPASACAVCTQCARSAHAVRMQCNNLAFVAQCCQSWLVAQLSRNLTAIPKIPGSNPGVVKFLVCHPLGMPNPGERLGFNLVHKKCSPQNYKRGGGLGGSKVGWVGPKLGGWVLSKIPPPSYKRRATSTRRMCNQQENCTSNLASLQMQVTTFCCYKERVAVETV